MPRKSSKKFKPERKPFLEHFKTWLGIAATCIGILTALVFDIPQKIQEKWTPASARFYGVVIDEAGIPVGSAEIIVRDKEGGSDRIGFSETTSTGEFNFAVKTKPEETVWVTVNKDGHTGFEGYKTLLGNSTITFKLRE